MGALMGLLNGVIVHYFRVPTIIVTIATFNIYFGLLYVITDGKLINNSPPAVRDLRQHAALLPRPARSAAPTACRSCRSSGWRRWCSAGSSCAGPSSAGASSPSAATRSRPSGSASPSCGPDSSSSGSWSAALRGGGGGPPLHRPVGGPQHHRGQGAGGDRGGGDRRGQRVRRQGDAPRHLPGRAALRHPQQRADAARASPPTGTTSPSAWSSPWPSPSAPTSSCASSGRG